MKLFSFAWGAEAGVIASAEIRLTRTHAHISCAITVNPDGWAAPSFLAVPNPCCFCRFPFVPLAGEAPVSSLFAVIELLTVPWNEATIDGVFFYSAHGLWEPIVFLT